MDRKLSRREFNLWLSSLSLSTPAFASLGRENNSSSTSLTSLTRSNTRSNFNLTSTSISRRSYQDPIKKLNQLTSTLNFTGDEPDPNHERFWNIDGYIQKLGGVPAPTENQNVTIIGGGLSGLISGYYLKNLKPLILEQSSQFGGNSKGENFGGYLYSLGPAYIGIPTKNTESYKMLESIGVLKHGRIEKASEKDFFLNSKIRKDFWSGEHDNPLIYTQIKNFFRSFDTSGNRNHYYKNSLRNIESFNQMSVAQWIRSYFPQISANLREYFEYYCWSSFGATLEEVAAGEFLSWQSSEQNGVLVFPGGNSLITQFLYTHLKNHIGIEQLRTKSPVLKVIPGASHVDIVIEESLGKLKTIRSKFAIISAPKFIAKKIIHNISMSQKNAMDQIQYRSYVVGNISFNKKISTAGFDLYALDNKIPVNPTAANPFDKGFTDVVFSNWALGQGGQSNTLTFYKAFPYQGARQFLLNPYAHNKHRDYLLKELSPYLRELNLLPQDINSVRMTLWGHAVPVCLAKFASSPLLKLASQSIGNIYFANQDNLVSPSYESAEESALLAAKNILQKFRP